ncbi:subtilase family-domain-containing protein [Gigaspora margarita]|uniref:Subtilase family-domain-containing protein n=1 Tax=Gigaspora margarita TaxID=4874 RepID=A0A8H3XAD8_GIGMA|nr:subtilase family-domain-containing protein [Gigaspora margarita]
MVVRGSYGDENGEEQIEKRNFAVCGGGATMEICVSQYWSSMENHDISVFHGIQLSNNDISGSNPVFINGGFTRLDITALVRRETSSVRKFDQQNQP